MAKKYLSLEEAAAQLGINTSELNRLRERGEIRGFADRGTWKFKGEDVEEIGRRRQADSNPSVPLLDSGMALDDEPDSGSSSVLSADEDVLGDQPTIIRGGQGDLVGPSDSDVRLVLDDSLTGEGDDSEPDVALAPMSDSDSDVQLAEEPASLVDSRSDSDVKLVQNDSDSDVKLVEPDSDSDVTLVGQTEGDTNLSAGAGEPGSDSDVRLLDPAGDTENEVAFVTPGGASHQSDDDDEPLALSEESGIGFAADSGIALAADSGVALDGPEDSGISLESPGSSVVLGEEDDDGPTLGGPEESGIALAGIDDSGIALDDADDSGIALAGLAGKGGDQTETIPMLDTPRGGRERGDDETQFEVPSLGEEDSEYELAMDGESSAGDANVILFDDDEAVDDRTQTVVKKSAREPEDEFDMMDGDEFDFDGEQGFDEELEVAEDVLEEDEELEELEAFDEDFVEDSFQSGESHPDFVGAAPAGQIAAPVEQEWGAATFTGLALGTLLMVVCSMLMFDFVRSMWSWNQPSPISSTLLEQIGGFFKK